MAEAVSRRLLTAEARVRSRVPPCGNFWWTKWRWDRFFSEYFCYSLYHPTRAQLKWKNRKKRLIISITGLHHKPSVGGASVASAAGPFNKRKTLELANAIGICLKAESNQENLCGNAHSQDTYWLSSRQSRKPKLEIRYLWAEAHLSCIQNFSLHLALKSHILLDKDQPATAVWGSNRCLL
jgi:hypothetical protein